LTTGCVRAGFAGPADLPPLGGTFVPADFIITAAAGF
jgi:hypothetical protein